MSTKPGDPVAEALAEIRRSPHERVKVAVTDMDGVLRGKFLLKEKFLSAAASGFGFCDVVLGWDSADVCYDNVKTTGWHSGYPDARVGLDLRTTRFVPWEDKVPFVLGAFELADGSPHPICPRQLLAGVIARARALGFEPSFGLEFEWFNFQEDPDSLADKGYDRRKLVPITPGMFGYSVLRASQSSDYFRDLMEQLRDFGVPLEGLHTETGPGVYEAAIRYSEALEAADRASLFKTAVKEIAHRNGVTASFMARWNPELPGCSGHIHQSLWDSDGVENRFADAEGDRGMSETMRQYIAGQARCLPDILPMFAPTVNSYKRLVEGYWAPTRVTWGVDNRTVALRVIPGSPASTRLETRVGGSDINPYLAVAAALASGLYGIENELELSLPETRGNGYLAREATRLPGNLDAASRRMARSDLARELFGDDFVDHFTASRDWEWRQFQQAVTDWEMRRYFEII